MVWYWWVLFVTLYFRLGNLIARHAAKTWNEDVVSFRLLNDLNTWEKIRFFCYFPYNFLGRRKIPIRYTSTIFSSSGESSTTRLPYDHEYVTFITFFWPIKVLWFAVACISILLYLLLFSTLSLPNIKVPQKKQKADPVSPKLRIEELRDQKDRLLRAQSQHEIELEAVEQQILEEEAAQAAKISSNEVYRSSPASEYS